MARRSTPERIDKARHDATRNRLIASGMTEGTADAWIAAWAVRAAAEGIERGAAYWDAGWEWIEAERRTRTRP